MSISVVLAVQDQAVSNALEELLDDESGFVVRAVGTSAEELLAVVLDHEPDAVLLHEDFGPAPALTVARELVGRLPWVSIVLLTREPTVDLYASASDAGIRALVSMPPSLADLSARLNASAWWSRSVRLGSESKSSYDEAGTVLAVAGAKGGVGVTTIATQLAFVAVSDKARRVCLVDLDLFGADLAAYLGTTASRSLLELIDLSDELNPGVMQPTLFPHESGIRVLFAPDDVADAELITSSLVRRTIAVLRSMFDVVVIDCGSRISDAALPAVELADRVALVVTPDLLSVRAAHRVAEAWERLDARRIDAVEMVINRASKGSAVQPRLVGQTSAMPVCRVSLPASFRMLETLANEGASGLKNQRAMARPLRSLALHFGILTPPESSFTPLWRRRRSVADPDQAETENDVAARKPLRVTAGGGGALAHPAGTVAGEAVPAAFEPPEDLPEEVPQDAAPVAVPAREPGAPPGTPAGRDGDGDGAGDRRGRAPARPGWASPAGGSDQGTIAADTAALALLLVFGVVAAMQLILLGWSAVVLAAVTPAAADAVARGETVASVEARLRSGTGMVYEGARVERSGSEVVVTVPVPLVLSVLGPTAAASISSDAEVVPRAAPAS